MVECVIDSVRISLTNQDRIIVLKDKEAERYLPIWIGLYESEAITIALQNIATARPLTHDLMHTLINSLGARLLSVEISAMEADTYYANLVLEVEGERKFIDCRPSDAIALVVRAGVPIFVDDEILEDVAITPEDVSPLPLEGEAFDYPENDSDSLSVFENFLDQLDEDELDDDQSDQPDDDNPPETPVA